MGYKWCHQKQVEEKSLRFDSAGKFKITGRSSVIPVSPTQSRSNSIVHMHVHNHLLVSTSYSVKQLYNTHFRKKNNGQRVDICYTYISDLMIVSEWIQIQKLFTFWESFVKIPELASSQRVISKGNIFRLDKTWSLNRFLSYKGNYYTIYSDKLEAAIREWEKLKRPTVLNIYIMVIIPQSSRYLKSILEISNKTLDWFYFLLAPLLIWISVSKQESDMVPGTFATMKCLLFRN